MTRAKSGKPPKTIETHGFPVLSFENVKRWKQNCIRYRQMNDVIGDLEGSAYFRGATDAFERIINSLWSRKP